MSSPFYMLVSSLPRIPRHFKVSAPPISRTQLEKRLQLLPKEQLSQLYAIETLIWKSWFNPMQSVEQTKADYHKLAEHAGDYIGNIMRWFLGFRSILAAIRMRNSKRRRPEIPEDYWISRWGRRLINQWDEPEFGLKNVYPWLPKINTDIHENNSAVVEEFVLTEVWRYLARIETGHYFDFEALVIYVLRWNIIQYWSGYSEANLSDEVEKLVRAISEAP
ncbi:V-type ATP synthase subunit A [Legionella birminghamensis]|uniref:V-type ATP synthase subunit A n=1 Tax=Legionella birminghamensis TaxID=28083 RepID=A0A378IAL4_9GAMM|nr:DUF2764 family protein [Legionella birminghamensis]KTC75957.1 V-type ATP synthase subunit A [Legionella birminghamensis]STX32083.1 V-type ATP synthase subunit A [Legionella birminghamensis]